MIVVATEQLPDLTTSTDDRTASGPSASATEVAIALARLRQPVGLLALNGDEPARSTFTVATHDTGSIAPEQRPGTRAWRWTAADVPHRLESPTIAVHAGSQASGADAATLEELFVRERGRAAVTVSLDLHARPSTSEGTEPAHAWVLRQIRRADIVTASERDLARLYPGVPPSAIAAYWHDEGVACCAVTSRRDGAMLLAPNGLAYRRTFPAGPPTDNDVTASAFTAGLLAALSAIGALGDDPAARLADVRPQQWLTVLEHADSVARAQAGVAHRRHARRSGSSSARPPQPVR